MSARFMIGHGAYHPASGTHFRAWLYVEEAPSADAALRRAARRFPGADGRVLFARLPSDAEVMASHRAGRRAS